MVPRGLPVKTITQSTTTPTRNPHTKFVIVQMFKKQNKMLKKNFVLLCTEDKRLGTISLALQ